MDNQQNKANFKVLGNWLAKKLVSAAISNFTSWILQGLKRGQYTIPLKENRLLLHYRSGYCGEDIPGWSVASKGSLTVALDITSQMNPNRRRGKEFVNRVQNIRKESGFDLTDRIFVSVQEAPLLKPSIIRYNDYICREILADSIDWVPEILNGADIDINGILLKVVVNKKG